METQDFSSVLDILSNIETNEAKDFWSMWHSSNSLGNFLLGKTPITIIEYFYDLEGQIQTLEKLSRAQDNLICTLQNDIENNYRGSISDNYLALKIEHESTQSDGRIIFIPTDLAIHTLKEAFGCSFHSSEEKLLLQIIMGLDLKTAAKRDNLSYETKRSQLKSLLSKTSSKRQIDLSNASLTHLFLALHTSAPQISNVKKHATFHEYCERFLPVNVRKHIILDETGEEQRLIDMGPRSGHPLMILHPQILPYISNAELKVLHRLNLRLIWPLRNGALAPTDTDLSFELHLQKSLNGINAARQLFFETPFTIICLISSVYFGLEYALKSPSQLSNIIFVGACYKPIRKGNAAGRLRNGFINLSSRNELLMKVILGFLAKKLQAVEKLQKMLSDIYSISEPDAQIIAEEFKSIPRSENIHFRFLKSVKSVKHDFFHQAYSNWQNAEKIKTPMTFIHGEEDKIHPIKNIEDLAISLNAELRAIPNCGQLAYLEHFESIFKIIKAKISD